MIGRVKWFNDTKGFGFIRTEGVSEDIFVHHSAIHMEGYRVLFPDQEVEFELKTDALGGNRHGGLKAVKVRLIETKPAPTPAKGA
jgi:CspA family cold shock protein